MEFQYSRALSALEIDGDGAPMSPPFTSLMPALTSPRQAVASPTNRNKFLSPRVRTLSKEARQTVELASLRTSTNENTKTVPDVANSPLRRATTHLSPIINRDRKAKSVCFNQTPSPILQRLQPSLSEAEVADFSPRKITLTKSLSAGDLKSYTHLESSMIPQPMVRANSISLVDLSSIFEFKVQSPSEDVSRAVRDHWDQPTKKWYILLPEDRFRLGWNVVLLLLLLYTACITPFQISFVPAEDPDWMAAELTIDALFFVDLVINFFTAVHNSNRVLIVGHAAIAKRYITGWLGFDVIAIIPFGIFTDSNGVNRLARIARLPRLFRLFRMFTLFKLFRVVRMQESIRKMQTFFKFNAGLLRLVKVSLAMLFMAHLLACIWHYLAFVDNYPSDSWVSIYNLVDADVGELYLVSLYWSFSTLATVGFGDIAANRISERIFSIVAICFGVTFYSFLIANITSIVQKLDTRETIIAEKRSAVEDFLKDVKLPRDLQSRVLRAMDFQFRDDSHAFIKNREAVLADLPPSLRNEILLFLHRKLISQNSFFIGQNDSDFVAALVHHLRPAQFIKGDTIIRQGERAMDIYFLTRGRAKLHEKKSNLTFGQVEEDAYFGEVGVLLATTHLFSVTALTDCEVLTVSKENLYSVLKSFPLVATNLKRNALDTRNKIVAAIKANESMHNGSHSRNRTSSQADFALSLTLPPTKEDRSERMARIEQQMEQQQGRLTQLDTKLELISVTLNRLTSALVPNQQPILPWPKSIAIPESGSPVNQVTSASTPDTPTFSDLRKDIRKSPNGSLKDLFAVSAKDLNKLSRAGSKSKLGLVQPDSNSETGTGSTADVEAGEFQDLSNPTVEPVASLSTYLRQKLN